MAVMIAIKMMTRVKTSPSISSIVFIVVFWLQGNRALLSEIIHNDYLPSTIIFIYFHRHKKPATSKKQQNLMTGRGED